MNKLEVMKEAAKLPVDERLDLIDAIYDTMEDGDIPLTDRHKFELDARLGTLEQDRKTAKPWNEIRNKYPQP